MRSYFVQHTKYVIRIAVNTNCCILKGFVISRTEEVLSDWWLLVAVGIWFTIASEANAIILCI